MLTKVISGMQTGADQGGLEAARRCNIPTGGWCTSDYKTEDGPRKDLATQFGLKCAKSTSYPDRTHLNARDADVTFWFGSDSSRGFRCTAKAVYGNAKVLIKVTEDQMNETQARRVAELLKSGPVHVLNVAGNRESKNLGLYVKVTKFLTDTFLFMKGGNAACLACNWDKPMCQTCPRRPVVKL